MNMKQYGFTGNTDALPIGNIPGRVTEQQKGQYTVFTERGEVMATMKGSFYYRAEESSDFPCVGDFVAIEFNPNGLSQISELIPRRSKFSRADFSGHGAGYVKTIKEQMVAANFDYVYIITSLNRDFRLNRIMRYITQAHLSGAQPVVILTKADLVEDFSTQVEGVHQIAPDVPVHAISSHTGFGLEALNAYLQPGKTVVFLGMSGVGKSSLLNALSGEDLMVTKETRHEDESKGSHTTTHRQLFMLSSGAMVIDTPGMRELGLIGADEGISVGFSDVEELFTQCRFNDCRHQTEPGCAVLAALANGSLSCEQWERYQSQKRENKFVDDKAAFMRERNELHKSWAKSNRAGIKAAKKHGGKKK